MMPVLCTSTKPLPLCSIPPSEILTKSQHPVHVVKSHNVYLKVTFLAGQVEWDSLVYISGTCTGTVLQQEGDEVLPAMQGSNVQWGRAILVGHIHTKPTERNLGQLLVSAEDGERNVIRGVKKQAERIKSHLPPPSPCAKCGIWTPVAHKLIPTTFKKV